MAVQDTVKTVSTIATGLEILASILKHPEYNGTIENAAALTNHVVLHDDPVAVASSLVDLLKGFNIKL